MVALEVCHHFDYFNYPELHGLMGVLANLHYANDHRKCKANSSMETSCSDEIYVDCSDDEKYDVKARDNKWLPPSEEVFRLYNELAEKGSLELEWQCPGRRPPTPIDVGHAKSSSDDIMDEEQMDKSDFDFQEEMSHLNLAVRPTGDCTPKGSAKKKTTTFQGVLSNFARHRKQNMITDDSGNQ